MIKRSLITEITLNCKKAETIAYKVYTKLAKLFNDKKIAGFFRSMANDEKKHIKFWEKLIDLSVANSIPEIFSKPEKILNELIDLVKNAEAQYLSLDDQISASEAFLLAYKLEFYLMYPALETLFHYIKNFDSKKNPEDDYHHHIEKLIKATKNFNLDSPELKLMGEALERLWSNNKKLAFSVSYDELTQILNRKGFFDIITPLCHLSSRAGYSVAFLMIDIDGFKEVNDTYGHQKGDELLALVAQLIKSSIRKSDIVGRYGGEEFIVFLSNINEDYILGLAEKVRQRIEEGSLKSIPVTVSIGVSYGQFYGNIEKAIDEYLQRADFNLYKAKKNGKNQIIL